MSRNSFARITAQVQSAVLEVGQSRAQGAIVSRRIYSEVGSQYSIYKYCAICKGLYIVKVRRSDFACRARKVSPPYTSIRNKHKKDLFFSGYSLFDDKRLARQRGLKYIPSRAISLAVFCEDIFLGNVLTLAVDKARAQDAHMSAEAR